LFYRDFRVAIQRQHASIGNWKALTDFPCGFGALPLATGYSRAGNHAMSAPTFSATRSPIAPVPTITAPASAWGWAS
jgi:hypothetical protein